MRRFALLALGGCAQIFGLDPTSSPQARSASVQLVRRSVGAAPSDALEAASVTWLYTGSDGSLEHVVGVQGSDRVYRTTFPPGSGAPPVELQFGTDSEFSPTTRVLLELPSLDVQLADVVYETADAATAPETALVLPVQMTTSVTYAAGDRYFMEIIGGWGYHQFSDAELAAIEPGSDGTIAGSSVSATETWDTGSDDTFTPWVAAEPLEVIGSADAVVAVHYTGNQLVEAGAFPSFDGSALPPMIAATLTPVTAQPVGVNEYPQMAATVLAEPRPAGGAPSGSWKVDAAPGYASAATLGPQLNTATFAPTGSDPVAITAPFGDPFEWPAVYESHLSSTRSVAIGSAAAFGATSGAFDNYLLLGSGSGAPAIDLNTPAPLPIELTFAGTILATDGMTAPIDVTAPVEVAIQTDHPAAAGALYELSVFSLTLDATGTTWTRNLSYIVMSPQPTLSVPSDAFANGGTYIIGASVYAGGFPNSAAGDLATRTLPLSDSYSESAAFTVTAQ